MTRPCSARPVATTTNASANVSLSSLRGTSTAKAARPYAMMNPRTLVPTRSDCGDSSIDAVSGGGRSAGLGRRHDRQLARGLAERVAHLHRVPGTQDLGEAWIRACHLACLFAHQLFEGSDVGRLDRN